MNAVRTDYHIHTTLCHHAVGDPIEYVQAAQRAGLTEIGFADHNPMPEQFDAWRISRNTLKWWKELDQPDSLFALVSNAISSMATKPGLRNWQEWRSGTI